MFEISLDNETADTYSCAADDTLLRAGLRAGLDLPYECSVGRCGSCKVHLLCGEVSSPQSAVSALSQRDHERGRRLACQSQPLSNCRIRFLGAAPTKDGAVPRPQRFKAKLKSFRDLTHDMREFRFQAPTRANFLPGQYALFDLADAGSRAYSMSNIPNGSNEWDFIIRNVPGGVGTRALFEAKVGDTIFMDGPFGHAYLREQGDRSICCIAGGSGLAPMLSIARAFDHSLAYGNTSLQFLFGGRTSADICGRSELSELATFGRRLFFHSAVSSAEGDASELEQKFVHELLMDKFGEALLNFDFYCAGPPKMIEALTAVLHQNDVDKSRIRYDRFF